MRCARNDAGEIGVGACDRTDWPRVNGRPSGEPVDVLTGFLAGDKAMGRPVGVEIARDGALLVADDVGNTVWRVSAS